MKHSFRYEPQQSGPQYLEDLATGYWYSEVLFTAVELGIFSLLDPEGMSSAELSRSLGMKTWPVERFLHALCALGLLWREGDRYFNSSLSRDYLVRGAPDYQGESILWRKSLRSHWMGLPECLKAGGRVRHNPDGEGPAHIAARIRKYISAMDGVARCKVREIIPLFCSFPEGGEILDVGAGSGAVAAGFLDRFPSSAATLLDIPEVLEYTAELMQARGLGDRVTLLPANILETWPADAGRYDLVILSNIIHAYSSSELAPLLLRASQCLKEEGIMLIHDFFLEHSPEKAALSDLNMFINTYNGNIFSQRNVLEEIGKLNLFALEPVALDSDTALLIAARKEAALSSVSVDKQARLIAKVQALGFRHVRPLAASSIHVADWTDLRCRYGCERYGSPCCPPHSPSPEKMRRLLADYSHGLLMEGEPPTKVFQQRVLRAEREAFLAGFHKTFALWAGPCSLCSACGADGKCANPRESRPSMEGAGIDVFET
ncbi:MAG TPA: DUF2284 domain-containing protein, partial [Dissulfurispiraceae bacterium]